MWFFQFKLNKQAVSLLCSRMQGNTMSVDHYHTSMFRTYPQVVKYIFQTYAIHKVIQEAYAELLDYHQSSEQTELELMKSLLAMAFRCSNVFSTTQLKLLLADNNFKASKLQLINHLATNQKVD